MGMFVYGAEPGVRAGGVGVGGVGDFHEISSEINYTHM